jgi:hypothetical protein
MYIDISIKYFILIMLKHYKTQDNPVLYEPHAADDSYTRSMTPGSTAIIDLPYGSTVEDYRLVFTKQTSSLTSGNFSVKTK